MMRFAAEVIKMRRLELGLNQQALGDLVEISQVWVHNFEVFKHEPNASMLCRLADALELSIDELFTEAT